MKILLQLNNPYGLGADRWVVQGYKDAFTDLGHSADFFTEKDNLRRKIVEFQPDIFFTTLDVLGRDKQAAEILMTEHKRGLRAFFNVGEDFKKHVQILKSLAARGVADVFYSLYAAEVMDGFEEIVGEPLKFIHLAANRKLHFPVAPDPKFAADISFLGARLSTKEFFFRNMLLPLAKKHKVKIYGPGWTMKDKALRILSGIGRKGELFPLAEWANKQRVSVSPENERKIYASSRISVNIHEYYPNGRSKNLSNEREFKIPACGGFQISDYVAGIERFFEPDKEIVIARSLGEWSEKIDFYITREKERKAIQERGTARALREHTYHNRVEQILGIYNALR